jgi:hypothetical protein
MLHLSYPSYLSFDFLSFAFASITIEKTVTCTLSKKVLNEVVKINKNGVVSLFATQ